MENFMDWLVINLPFLIVVALLIIRVIISVKRGFVKELCSLIATVVASLAILLIALAVQKYFAEDRIIMAVTIILLFLLCIIYKIIDTFLVALKLISKLPVVKILDKVLGVVIGVAEVLVVVWTVYCLIMVLDTGFFEKWIMDCVRNNAIMGKLYEYNYIYSLMSKFSTKLQSINIISKLGR